MVAEFRERRDVIVDGLNSIPGIRCRNAAGRVLCLPEHHRHGDEEQRAGAVPAATRRAWPRLSGTSFGAYGEGYLRLSYANSVENLNKALAAHRRRPGKR